jgi:hypothetical protein
MAYSKSRLYTTWKDMKKRCYNASVKDYPRYGGRGITVCDEWRHDFFKFVDWAYRAGYWDEASIDRINPNDGYHPGNCRWVTCYYNSIRGKATKITYNGISKSMKQWSWDVFDNDYTVRNRLSAGWSVEKTLTTPIKRIIKSSNKIKQVISVTKEEVK